MIASTAEQVSTSTGERASEHEEGYQPTSLGVTLVHKIPTRDPTPSPSRRFLRALQSKIFGIIMDVEAAAFFPFNLQQRVIVPRAGAPSDLDHAAFARQRAMLRGIGREPCNTRPNGVAMSAGKAMGSPATLIRAELSET